MGLFKNMKDAVGQANAARAQAGTIGQAIPAGGVAKGLADRHAIEEQAREQNRILRVGAPGRATVTGHVDTGELVAGNPVWLLELSVTPEGGEPYAVRRREIVSSATMSGYADGTTIACRIDPADKTVVAFGDQPWM